MRGTIRRVKRRCRSPACCDLCLESIRHWEQLQRGWSASMRLSAEARKASGRGSTFLGGTQGEVGEGEEEEGEERDAKVRGERARIVV